MTIKATIQPILRQTTSKDPHEHEVKKKERHPTKALSPRGATIKRRDKEGNCYPPPVCHEAHVPPNQKVAVASNTTANGKIRSSRSNTPKAGRHAAIQDFIRSIMTVSHYPGSFSFLQQVYVEETVSLSNICMIANYASLCLRLNDMTKVFPKRLQGDLRDLTRGWQREPTLG